jgi:hypothetical protein
MENQPNQTIQPSQPEEGQNTNQYTSTPSPVVIEKKSSKKKITIILVALLIVGAGGYFAYSQTHKKPVVTQSAPPVAQPQAKASVIAPDSVLYYTKAKEADPYSLYLRPATGGERKAVLTLSNKAANGSYYTFGGFDVKGQNVVFSTYDGIYSSTDGGSTFKNIHKLDPAKVKDNQAITSLKFSSDGKKIVFAFLPALVAGNINNTVSSMDLDGQNVAEVHKFANVAGVFIYNYDTQKNQLVYSTGCYFCDGGPGIPHLMDLKTGADKQLLQKNDAEILSDWQVSPDGQKLLYFVGTNDKQVADQVGGLGWQGAPPYKINELDLSTGQSVQLATVGTLHEKDTDGKFKNYIIQVGYTNDKHKAFYSADNKLYVLNGTNAGLEFESDKDIRDLSFVSTDEVLVSTYNTKGAADYTLYRYETSGKKSTSVLQGDVNTGLMGVTTK